MHSFNFCSQEGGEMISPVALGSNPASDANGEHGSQEFALFSGPQLTHQQMGTQWGLLRSGGAALGGC